MPRAIEIARDIAANTSPASVAVNRQLLWKLLDADHPRRAHELESRALSATLAGPDAAEGAAAFVEKRPPAFTSRPGDAGYMRSWWSRLTK